MLIVTHYHQIDNKVQIGSSTVLSEFLCEKKLNYSIIMLPIDGKSRRWVEMYKSGELITIQELVRHRVFGKIPYLSDVASTILYSFKVPKQESETYIGIDPLNAFVGYILKKVRRTHKLVFYSADYSLARFPSSTLSKIYLFLDKFCSKNADLIWNVSSRIKKIRSEMGISDDKNLFLPNIPAQSRLNVSMKSTNNYKIITVGSLNGQQDYFGLIDAVIDLHSTLPMIQLYIVGGGDEFTSLNNYIDSLNACDYIKLFGSVERDAVFELLNESSIGCALYKGDWNFNYFGDSMKCREYFSCGLPVLTTDTHSTVEDIVEYSAGIVCELSVESYKQGLISMFSNYNAFSEASSRLGSIHIEKFYDALDSINSHI